MHHFASPVSNSLAPLPNNILYSHLSKFQRGEGLDNRQLLIVLRDNKRRISELLHLIYSSGNNSEYHTLLDYVRVLYSMRYHES